VLVANPEALEWLEMGAFDQLKKRNQKTYQQLIYEMLKLEHHQQEIVLSLRKSELEWARGFLSDQGWREHEKIVGINVGGGGRWKKKRWKPHHFETFARQVIQTGNKVMLIGGQQERVLLDDLKSVLPVGVISSKADRSL